MKTIGVITYHAAYNFGSVLQAYAIQKSLEKLGYSVKIINYRPNQQRDFYTLCRRKMGIKTFLNDVLMLPIYKKRKTSHYRFEKFFESELKLTKEFSDPHIFKKIAGGFDVLISGSDQIWNPLSCELKGLDISYMEPYLLAGEHPKKISYASSIGDLKRDCSILCDYIKNYDGISVREYGAKK